MRIFVTGATGFIGRAVTRELITGGHSVLALSRSEDGAALLRGMGADVAQGSLHELERVLGAARTAEAIVHMAFNHDFSEFVTSARADGQVIEALGEVAASVGGPFLVTSGTLVVDAKAGQPATEEDPPKSPEQMPRAITERATMSLARAGTRAFVVRPSHVHDTAGRGGALKWLIELAREAGFSAYAGNGQQRWPACSLSDTATLYRIAIESGQAGKNYHAVAENGVPMCDIAEAVGALVGVPVRSLTGAEVGTHFGAVSSFVTQDSPASSNLTRKWLGWAPTGRGLVADIRGSSLT